MWQEFECPGCKEKFEIKVSRWSGETKCPHCEIGIDVDFDFIVLDDEDEWDQYELKLLKDHDKYNDQFESRKINNTRV